MKIAKVVFAEGATGFYTDDQQAIKQGAMQDGFLYSGQPVTDGFTNVRQPGQSVCIMLILEDGQIAYGDCVTVQYPGVGGRDPLFLAKELILQMEAHVSPLLTGKQLGTFREMAEEIDKMEINGARLHAAIRYGVTQALLDAVAKAHKITMAEVIRDEYQTNLDFARIPLFSQTGDERYSNADKMITRKLDVLPHGLINNVEKLGTQGETLKEYAGWLRDRILALRDTEQYTPIIHLDVYGTIGLAFDHDLGKMVDYLEELEQTVAPFQLRLEGPVDMGSRQRQLDVLKALKDTCRQRGLSVQIVADEWCNTLEDIQLFADEQAVDFIQIKTPDLGGVNNIIEAILYCKQKNVGAYSGGSCNETENSAKVSVHIAIACGADQCLAKPGMGVDEGYMIVFNEMQRVLALESARTKTN